MGWARRKDTAHNPIVEGLRANGIVVFDVSRLQKLGFDIVCFKSNAFPGTGGKWRVFELKTPQPAYTRKFSQPRRRAAKLTDSELRAARLAPIPCVETWEEALTYFLE